jgi:hypothetical protein
MIVGGNILDETWSRLSKLYIWLYTSMYRRKEEEATFARYITSHMEIDRE